MKYMNKPILVLGIIITSFIFVIYIINFSANQTEMEKYKKELRNAETMRDFYNVKCSELLGQVGTGTGSIEETLTCFAKERNNGNEIEKHKESIFKIEKDNKVNLVLLITSFITLLLTIIISFTTGYFNLNKKLREDNQYSNDVESKLLKLKELYEKNLITEVEYENRKNDIVSKI